ncbi:MAG: DNA-processing protein DprA, partial [Patescibacteria group bacterium]
MNLKYAVSLNQFSKFGPSRMNRLTKYFSSLETAFKASFNELVAAGIESQVAEEFLGLRPTINPDELMNKLEKEKVKVLTLEDNKYPKLLKEIYQPPFILYYRGRIEANNEFSLAVVGTRKYTNYGKQVTESIVKDLARNNLTIISGLAHGIDTLAHTACLDATGNTIAILGSGLDRENIYPANNRYLIDKIILSGGCVLSEFPLGTPPLK